MTTLRERGYDFGIIAARTVPDGAMGSNITKNGLVVGRDYPEDLRRYRKLTQGKVLVAGPNTAQHVLPQDGTLGRDVIIAGRHAPLDAPSVYTDLASALFAVKMGLFGDGRDVMVVGGPTMVRAACEYVEMSNIPGTGDMGMRALLLMTEILDEDERRIYPNEPGLPTLATLPDNVHEYYRKRQPNNVPGRPDFDFVSYNVY